MKLPELRLVPTRNLAGFFRDTRAAGTGVAAALFTVMSLAGVAFVGDHSHLVHQRDILQAASDAASIAAAKEMAGLRPGLSNAQVEAALYPIARRYTLANIPEGLRDRVAETLAIKLAIDRDAGIVDVDAVADMGGAVFGRWLWDDLASEISTESGIEEVHNVVEVMLALDVTGSMNNNIYASKTDRENAGCPENQPTNPGCSRIGVIRTAVGSLLQLLNSDGNAGEHVAVGLAPFNTTVNIDPSRTAWVSDVDGGYGTDHKTVPRQFGPWGGCIEHRLVDGYTDAQPDHLDVSLVTPSAGQFKMWFWPSDEDYNGRNNWARLVYNGFAQPKEPQYSKPSPHYGCPSNPLVPLTTDLDLILRRVAELEPMPGGGTMSHLGIVWGRRLLAPEWRDAWEDARFPLDRDESPNPANRKILILVSDGVNTVVPDYERGGYEYVSDYTGYGRVGRGHDPLNPGTEEDGFVEDSRFHSVQSVSYAQWVLNTLFLRSCGMARQEGIELLIVSLIPKGLDRDDVLHSITATLSYVANVDVPEGFIAGEATELLFETCTGSPENVFVANDPESVEEVFRKFEKRIRKFRRK